jgi:hypothetical protein
MQKGFDKQLLLVCEIALMYQRSSNAIYAMIRAKKISHDAIVLKRYKLGRLCNAKKYCKVYDVKKFEGFYAAAA